MSVSLREYACTDEHGREVIFQAEAVGEGKIRLSIQPSTATLKRSDVETIAALLRQTCGTISESKPKSRQIGGIIQPY